MGMRLEFNNNFLKWGFKIINFAVHYSKHSEKGKYTIQKCTGIGDQQLLGIH